MNDRFLFTSGSIEPAGYLFLTICRSRQFGGSFFTASVIG
jgi:hypothetical protein